MNLITSVALGGLFSARRWIWNMEPCATYVSDIANGVQSITELWSAGAPACGLPLFRSAILT
jgi:hypothetical protein